MFRRSFDGKMPTTFAYFTGRFMVKELLFVLIRWLGTVLGGWEGLCVFFGFFCVGLSCWF